MPMMIDILFIAIFLRHLALSSAGNNSVIQSVFLDYGNGDLLFNKGVLSTFTTRSLLDCGNHCTAKCECKAYTFINISPVTSTGKCRLYSGFPAAGSSRIGARTFAMKESAWLKKSCTETADCPGDLTTCHVGQCLCQPAAYYSNRADVCVESCDKQEDLCSTFLAYNGTDIDYDNFFSRYIDRQGSEADLDDVGLCQQHCLDKDNCHAIVHAVGGFEGDGSCWRVKSFDPAAVIKMEPWTLYKRTCI